MLRKYTHHWHQNWWVYFLSIFSVLVPPSSIQSAQKACYILFLEGSKLDMNWNQWLELRLRPGSRFREFEIGQASHTLIENSINDQRNVIFGFKVSDVFETACRQIIENRDLIATLQKLLRKMTSNKTGSASDECFPVFHRIAVSISDVKESCRHENHHQIVDLVLPTPCLCGMWGFPPIRPWWRFSES